MEAPPVQYVKTSDGYNIAYTVCGAGQPLVLLPAAVFHHVEAYWKRESWLKPWLFALASRFRLVQFDSRGQGLSTRGLPDHLSLADLYRDLEELLEYLRPGPVVLMAYGAKSCLALLYAAEHPERVLALVLAATSVEGNAWPSAMYNRLAAENWETFLLSQGAVGGTHTDAAATLARLGETITKEDYLVVTRALRSSDLTPVLSRVNTPTLVLHGRGFVTLPPSESIRVAAALPNSRLVLNDGDSSIGDVEPGAAAIDRFLADLQESSTSRTGLTASGLSAREIEVLRLIAAGKSNGQIADALVISPSTVLHHVTNILTKTGCANRTEAAVYARDRGIA
jgi:pimeloyl-ACP methyl ester carboxylesterase/DNA-binding CsgD family transcriptional regulator